MNKITRKQLLKMYGDRRRQDGREVGRHIHNLTQALMVFAQARVDPKNPEVQDTLKELVAIRKVNRFRDDFPSFAKFKKFLKDEDVSFKEAMEA